MCCGNKTGNVVVRGGPVANQPRTDDFIWLAFKRCVVCEVIGCPSFTCIDMALPGTSRKDHIGVALVINLGPGQAFDGSFQSRRSGV